MASQLSCRVCCIITGIKANRYRQLFATKAVYDDLPGRLSRIIGLPVSLADGLSSVICNPCIKKLESFEAFQSLARHSHQKQGYQEQIPPLAAPVCAPSSAPVKPAQKRTKDTSGTDASPFTMRSHPASKRITIGVGAKATGFHFYTMYECAYINVSIIIYNFF